MKKLSQYITCIIVKHIVVLPLLLLIGISTGLYAAPMYSNSVNSSLNNALRSLGVYQLHNMSKTGKGVTVVVHDIFPKSDSKDQYRDLTHGEMVRNYLTKTAPEATVLTVDLSRGFSGEEADSDSKYLRPDFILRHNVRIVNRSNGVSVPELYTNTMASVRFDKVIKITKMGVVVVFAAGNNNALLGTEPYGKALIDLARAVNEDRNNPGAIILVGSGVPNFREQSGRMQPEHPILSNYTAMAGVLRDYYVYAPVSTTVEHTGTDVFSHITGSSFSAPIVSGMIAILMEAFPKATGKEIANMIFSSASCPRVLSGMIRQKLERATDLSPEQINKLTPEDIYGRGEISLTRAFEVGKSPQKPEVKILINTNDQLIRAATYDIFSDKLYNMLEATTYSNQPTPLRVINFFERNYPWRDYKLPVFFKDGKHVVRPYADTALKFIFSAIESYRRKNLTEPKPAIVALLELYANVHPNSPQISKSLAREKEIIKRNENEITPDW